MLWYILYSEYNYFRVFWIEKKKNQKFNNLITLHVLKDGLYIPNYICQVEYV